MYKLCVYTVGMLSLCIAGGCMTSEHDSSHEVQQAKPETTQSLERVRLRKEIYAALLELIEESKKDGGRTVRVAQSTAARTDSGDNKIAKPEESAVKPTPVADAGQYFWHNAYHNEPHDANCRDENWHPYLRPGAGFGGDPGKYGMIDSQAEEVDVAAYPQEYKETYNTVIRGFCAACHSPARTLHQNYTPRQWKSSLAILRARYKEIGFNSEIEDKAYKFFVFYEERKLQEEERQFLAKTSPQPPVNTATVEKPVSTATVEKPVSTATVEKPVSTATVEKHFWHNAYHNEPHDANCRDVNWHPYLKPGAGFGGDTAKYEMVDSQSEEVDVATYPQDFKNTYHTVIRTFCASCHSPARTLHQNYTPRQWKSSLAILRGRYKSLGFTPEMEERLHKFFIYYEERKLRQEEGNNEPVDVRYIEDQPAKSPNLDDANKEPAPTKAPEATTDKPQPTVEQPAKPQPKTTDAPADNKPTDKPQPDAASEATDGKHFWHNAYHQEPHDASCRDINWHPYLRPNAPFGGDAAKYETTDSQSEEVDVSAYPEQHKSTYHGVIRTFCSSCHTPARVFHQNYTPRQWKSSIALMKTRYKKKGFTPDMEERLYKFFVYYEEQQLQKEDK